MMGMKGCRFQTGSDIELIKRDMGSKKMGVIGACQGKEKEVGNDRAINETLLT